MSDELTTIESEDLSLQEMLRVMDVARGLRKERETVEREFSREETRAALRERLLQTTAITGAELSEEELEAALDSYYDSLHVFRRPRPGVSTLFAHLWVLRRPIGFTLLLIGCLGLLGWWLWPRPIDPLTEAYEIRIVSGADQQSGIDRSYTDDAGTRAPAYYVIVQAVTVDGDVLRRTIRNAETGKLTTVRTWAERVPAAVFERIKEDKSSDGVLDETLFAVKRKDEPDIDVVLKSETGKPIDRGGQITNW